MGRRLWLVLWTVFVLLGHLLFDANTLYQQALSQRSGAYELNERRLTDRVVLVVLDSWALRTLADGRLMPKLFARQQTGASGVLWAPRQTGTIQGVLSLSTGTAPSGLAAIGLMSSSRFEGWTIFDDVAARGENVSFHGGPAWLPLFGDRGKGHFRETGHGPNFREEDVEGLAHSRQALLSARPPTLSVVHITETDVAAHQYGTERPEYAAVLAHWDDVLDDYLTQVLQPGTTVIITGDHGNDVNGSHGGSEPIYRRVPVVFLGQGIDRDNRIEMNAADMPATIAVLLGVRAPSAAVAMPAVHALRLTLVERGRVALTAYFHSLLNKAALKDRPELMAQARSAFPARTDDPKFGWLSEHHAKEMLPRLHATFRELEEHVGLVRVVNGMDWAFVVATFVLAMLTLWSVAPVKPLALPAGAAGWPAWRTWRGGLAVVAALLMVELLFGLRVTHADAVKGLARAGGGVLLAGAAGLAAVALLAGAACWHRRAMLLSLVREPCFWLVMGGYLLSTVLYPVNMVGLMVAMLLAAWLWQSPLPTRWRWAWLLLALILLAVSTKVWMLMGEGVPLRFMAGAGLACGACALLVWSTRRHALSMGYWPVALGLALLMLPFSSFNLLGWSGQAQLLVATASAMLLAAWAVRATAGDAWLLWPLLPTLWFWWWGVSQPWGLYLALAAGAVLAVTGARLAVTAGAPASVPARLLAAMVCMLMTLSAPLHVVSLLGFVLVALAFFQWQPTPSQRWPAVAMAAVVLVAARYGLFDLYGYADSPIQVYALKHLDLAAAYLGDESRAIAGAVLMVVVKIVLASVVLMQVAAFFAHWRPWLDDIMTVAMVFLLIQVGQAAVRASLAFGPRSHQYDFAAFSMLVHTGLLILGMVAYAFVRRVRVPPQDEISP